MNFNCFPRRMQRNTVKCNCCS